MKSRMKHPVTFTPGVDAGAKQGCFIPHLRCAVMRNKIFSTTLSRVADHSYNLITTPARTRTRRTDMLEPNGSSALNE